MPSARASTIVKSGLHAKSDNDDISYESSDKSGYNDELDHDKIELQEQIDSSQAALENVVRSSDFSQSNGDFNRGEERKSQNRKSLF